MTGNTLDMLFCRPESDQGLSAGWKSANWYCQVGETCKNFLHPSHRAREIEEWATKTK